MLASSVVIRDIGRYGDTDRVRERHLIRARGNDPSQHLTQPVERHLALEGTPERRTDRDRHEHPGGPCLRHERRGGRAGLGRRHSLVALTKGVGGNDHDVDLVDSAGQGSFQTTLVHDETGVPDAVEPWEGGHQFVGVDELGDAARVDEAGDLDAAGAGADRAFDQLDLGFGRQYGGLVAALTAGDPDWAESVMRSHVRAAWTTLRTE
jgi:hypothetical protein